MKRITITFAAVFMLICALCGSAAADYEPIAEALAAVGMFRGTEKGFELDRAPTRSEAAIMLVRLYGAEEEANAKYKAGEISFPFKDVSEFASPYIAWLYDKGITRGTSPTAFGSQSPCGMANYVAFLLRALGYRDGIDFQYENILLFAAEKGIKTDDISGRAFSRGDLALLTCRGLGAYLKGETPPRGLYLLQSLLNSGSVDIDGANLGLNQYVAASMNGKNEIASCALQPEEGRVTRWKAVATGMTFTYICQSPVNRNAYQSRPDYRITWLPDGWTLNEMSSYVYRIPEFTSIVDAEWRYNAPDGGSIAFRCAYPTNCATEYENYFQFGRYVDIQGRKAELYTISDSRGAESVAANSLLAWENEDGLLFEFRADGVSVDTLIKIAQSVQLYNSEPVDYQLTRIPSGYHEFRNLNAAGYQQIEWQNRDGKRLLLICSPDPISPSLSETEIVKIDGENGEIEMRYQPPMRNQGQTAEKSLVMIDGDEYDGSASSDGVDVDVTPKNNLLWDDCGFVSWDDPKTGVHFQLRGAFGKDRLIQLANGVKAQR